MEHTELNTAAAKWFDTSHLVGDLKSKSVKGGINTVMSQMASFGLSMASTVLLARMLEPDNFGVVAMVTAFTGFATIFKDLGLSIAVVQRETIDQREVSSLFWLNVIISLIIALLVLAAGPLLVAFYEEPRILPLTWLFAASIFIAGLSLQHGALLKRQMQFLRLSYIQVGAMAISVVFSLSLALLDYGIWAVAAVTVSQPIFASILLWIFCDWRPAFILDWQRSKDFLSFGTRITGFDMINYFSRNTDKMLIGRYVGSAALGFYSKAYQLLMLPISQLRDPLNSVALPALSKLRGEGTKYRDFYKRYLFLFSFFYMPIVVGLGVYAKEFIFIMLGPGWEETATLFQLLAIASLVQPAASTKGVVMISMGMTRKYLRWGIIYATWTVSGFVVGINWGMYGVAMAYIITDLSILIPSLIWCFKGSSVSLKDFLGEISYPLIFSILGGAVTVLLNRYFSGEAPILELCIGLGVGVTTYLLCWLSTADTRNKLKQVLEIKSFLKKK